MCNRYSFFGSVGILKSTFGIEAMDSEPVANHNITPSQFAPAILYSEGRIQLRHLHWGLIPSWATEPDIAAFMINAGEDSLHLMPCFKHAFKRRRCLIPADGYFEWACENGRKQPYFITSDSGELFGFAGLWENWVDPSSGNTIESFTIVTTSALPGASLRIDRMPVILTRESYRDWLDPELQDSDALTRILGTGREYQIKFNKVSSGAGSTLDIAPELFGPGTFRAHRPATTGIPAAGAIDLDWIAPRCGDRSVTPMESAFCV